jgi:hypothetical protein
MSIYIALFTSDTVLARGLCGRLNYLKLCTIRLSKSTRTQETSLRRGKPAIQVVRLAIGAMGTPCDLLAELVGAEAPSLSTLGVLSTPPYVSGTYFDPP